MRYHSLRFDIWLCLLFSFIISYIPATITDSAMSKKYNNYVKEKTALDGEIGGKANDKVFRAQNIEDLLSHDTFTVISPGIEYRNKGAGYFKNYYLYALTLPSGERVAARINTEAVMSSSDSIYSGESILPVGKIVYEDLSKNKTFLSQIEYSKPLNRKDFYIDMVGNASRVSKDDYVGIPKLLAQLLTIVILFPIFHSIGSKLGIFPYFFAPKKKKEQIWK